MFEEGLLLDCPRCGIKITVPYDTCREGRKFNCPICGAEVCFSFPEDELRKLIESEKRKQEKELTRSFPLSFGRI
jgi:transcription initiation factor IIE alpha subunit